MIKSFGNKVAADIYQTGASNKVPRKLWQRSVFLLDVLEAVDSLDELKSKGFPPSIRLHKLKGSRSKEWAIDIHKIEGWRITFRFEDSEFIEVKVEDYH